MTVVWRAANLFLLLLAVSAALANDRAGATGKGPSAAAACTVNPTTLCLNNQRFKVEVQWKDFEGKIGVGQAVALTSDTGYFWFFNSSNVELVVKVLDGRSLNGRFWVFFGALSNVEYTMRVTDTATGALTTYFNPSGRFASVGDTGAFSGSDSSARYVETDVALSGSSSTVGFPRQELPQLLQRVPAEEASAVTACGDPQTSLCLGSGRFRVEVNWTDFQGKSEVGKPASLTSDTGYFWFFDSANVELVLKVLDARALNGRFWVFFGALSNVKYEITVTDTLTGSVNTYSNPLGRFASTGDTNGFRSGFEVVVHPDTSRAVSKEIPTTGGTITATAADGTVFTLTVPDKALLSEATLTLTPVATIDRLPLSGGFAAAVDLAPAGLRLFRPATLTIVPAAAVPIAEEITFAWRGNGEEFFLYPPELGTPRISMKLMHFSGYGVGRGSAADEAAQQLRIPASPEDALSQRLQAPLANKRRSALNGIRSTLANQADDTAAVVAALEQHYYTFLEFQLDIIRTNCSKAKPIISLALGWATIVQVLDLSNVFSGELANMNRAIEDALVNCYNESFTRCLDRNDPTQVPQMLGFARQLELLGVSSSERIDFAKLERCARFELEFESVVEELQPEGPSFAWRHHVRATVPDLVMRLCVECGQGNGSAELVYSSVQYIGVEVPPTCTQKTVGTNSEFQVLKTIIDVNPYEGGRPSPEPVKMLYDPGHPHFLFTMTCPVPQSVPLELILDQDRWRDVYNGNHTERFGSAFVALGWGRVGGRIWARKSYHLPSSHVVEITIMNLRHTPK